ncbi:MAG: tetratricopeptide repeat protein [Deltaproteobacteria bacterium]|nr:tetratricopeptide repeat protein [Deltaproteobacteria bacterium]
MFCPHCSSKVDPEAILCSRCGMEGVFPSSSDRVCDLFLMGYADPSVADQVIDFLKSRTFWESSEEFQARLGQLPLLLTKEMSLERAHVLRTELEGTGAIIEIRERRMRGRGMAKKLGEPEEENPEPVSVKKSGWSGSGYLLLLVLSLLSVIYLGLHRNFTQDRKSVERAVRKITSHFPESLSRNGSRRIPVGAVEKVDVSARKDSEGIRWNNEGVTFMKEGRYDDAVDRFQRALKRLPDEIVLRRNLQRAWLQKGYAAMKGKDNEGAIAAFEEAVKVLDPSPDIYKFMGVAALNLSDTTRAERYFKEYLSRVPRDPEVEKMFGELLYKQNRLKEGISHLKNYLSANPDDVKIRKLVDKAGREAEAEAGFDTREGEHFDVRYDGRENTEAGWLVISLLDEAYQRIGAEFNYYPAGRLTTILYSDDDFRAVTRTPDWTGGVYDGKIRIPIGGLKERSDQLERVVNHEYTHALIRRMVGRDIPTWLNEGLAQYFEGEPLKVHDRNVAYILRSRDVLPLRDLEGSFLKMGGDTASLAYTESFTVVDYIIRNHGIYAVQKMLGDLASGVPFEKSLVAATGMDYAGLREAWLQDLEKKYP